MWYTNLDWVKWGASRLWIFAKLCDMLWMSRFFAYPLWVSTKLYGTICESLLSYETSLATISVILWIACKTCRSFVWVVSKSTPTKHPKKNNYRQRQHEWSLVLVVVVMVPVGSTTSIITYLCTRCVARAPKGPTCLLFFCKICFLTRLSKSFFNKVSNQLHHKKLPLTPLTESRTS